MENKILVNSGDTKRRIQYRRNALLGTIGIIKKLMKYILKSGFITRREMVYTESTYKRLIQLDELMRDNKSKVIQVVPPNN